MNVGPATSVAGAIDPDPQHERRWWILAVVGLAQLMVVLDATIVNIALPTAQRALGFSTADRQWVVTAYTLAFGGLLLVGGRLSDMMGRKRMLIIGLVGFACASALGGASTSFAMLVIARGIQGALGAMLAPAALSLLTTTFADPAERGKAFGIYGAIAGAGGAIGLLLGGLLTEYLSWRWCLYVNLLFASAAVAGGSVLLVNQRGSTDQPLDIPGSIAAVGGLVAVVYGLSEAETKSWGDPLTLGLILGGVALLGIFVWIESRVPHPLLPLRVVLNRNRGSSYLAVLFTGAGMFGVFLFLTYYLQRTLGYSPVLTGVAFLPMIAGLILVSTISTGFLLPLVGPRPLVVTGMVVSAGGMAVLTQLSVDSSYVSLVLPGLLITGIGLGLVFGTAMNMATYGAVVAEAGVASAMVNTSQQIGGSIGTALLNTIAASAATSYLVGKVPSLPTAARAVVHGDTTAFAVVVGIFLAAAVICALLYEGGAVDRHEVASVRVQPDVAVVAA